MPESSERRAQRKLMADAYRFMPSREVLQAATHLEQAKTEGRTREEQLAVQKGSLAVAVLSQIPRDIEENKPVFHAARELLIEILRTGLASLRDLGGHDLGADEDDPEVVALSNTAE